MGGNNERRITLPPRNYQPNASKLKEQIDMPGADMEMLRRAFTQPVEIEKVRQAGE